MRDSLATPRREPIARAIDVVLASLLLMLAVPMLLGLVVAILVTDGSPVLFTQVRLGRGGVPFRLHKLRSQRAADGPTVATAGDARTTKLGRWMRRLHLDELPQLFDVLRGRMALVGPRPEVPANLAGVSGEDLDRVLLVRPGITGPTQLAFLAEDDVLAEVADPVAAYRRVLVPAKVAADRQWLASRTLASDLRHLCATPFVVGSRRARERSRARIEQILARQGIERLAMPATGE